MQQDLEKKFPVAPAGKGPDQPAESLPGVGPNLAASQVARLREKLDAAEVRQKQLEEEKRRLARKREHPEIELPPVPAGFVAQLEGDPVIAGINRQVALWQKQMNYVVDLSGDKNNPAVRELTRKMAEAAQARTRSQRAHPGISEEPTPGSRSQAPCRRREGRCRDRQPEGGAGKDQDGDEGIRSQARENPARHRRSQRLQQGRHEDAFGDHWRHDGKSQSAASGTQCADARAIVPESGRADETRRQETVARRRGRRTDWLSIRWARRRRVRIARTADDERGRRTARYAWPNRRRHSGRPHILRPASGGHGPSRRGDREDTRQPDTAIRQAGGQGRDGDQRPDR